MTLVVRVAATGGPIQGEEQRAASIHIAEEIKAMNSRKITIIQPGQPLKLKLSRAITSRPNGGAIQTNAKQRSRKKQGGGERQLSERDASIIKAMLRRGDKQQDIAAWFGVNIGRIAEIESYKTYPEVTPFKGKLPPSGPYDVPKLHAQRDTARRRMATGSLDIQNAAADLENCLPAELLKGKECKEALSTLLCIASKLEAPL